MEGWGQRRGLGADRAVSKPTPSCLDADTGLGRPLVGAGNVESARPRAGNRTASHHTLSQGFRLEKETSMFSRRRLEGRFAFPSHAVHHHRRCRRPVLEILEGRVVLATFTVNSVGDAGIGSGDSGDLRYCINQANANDQANTIVFDSDRVPHAPDDHA